MLPPTLAFLPFIQGQLLQSPKSVYSDFLFFCQTNTRFVDLFLVYLPPNQWCMRGHFAVTNEYTDLASLKFLSIESDGSLFLYANTDDSTLPQDMYRMLSQPYAFNYVLRFRTSTDFKPGHSTFF
ncbi:hypothetical protein V6Z11_D05G327300 [Gossypium hirsutum]|uniref:Uncharacterized protein isoform X1 n=1 Tax=Gossypium hirsutum TaxID=3635 RepID=A0ABM3A1U1_GOSHI|nr:uncharacterized protein LOC107904060 isoform X1 [Gossypium hirsutum]